MSHSYLKKSKRDRLGGLARQILNGILYQLKNGCNSGDLPCIPATLLHSILALQAVALRPGVASKFEIPCTGTRGHRSKKTNVDNVANHRQISGVEYQQGELQGYEVREYLLEKWNRKFAYCGNENLPLQVEHINPRAKGGTNRVSNLCLACEKCHLKKGTQDIKDFLERKPEILKK